MKEKRRRFTSNRPYPNHGRSSASTSPLRGTPRKPSSTSYYIGIKSRGNEIHAASGRRKRHPQPSTAEGGYSDHNEGATGSWTTMTECQMKEEELIREAEKAKEEAEGARQAKGKNSAEINQLNHRHKHVKKEWKEDVAQFEKQLEKLMKELDDNEKKWSEEHQKLSQEAVEMTTGSQKLKTKVKQWNTEIEQLTLSRTHRSTVRRARRRRHEHEIPRTHSRLMRQ